MAWTAFVEYVQLSPLAGRICAAGTTPSLTLILLPRAFDNAAFRYCQGIGIQCRRGDDRLTDG